MRLLRRAEFEAHRPSARDIRAWLESPVTDWFFNIVFRLDAVGDTAETRDGFRRAQAQVLDSLLDLETLSGPVPAMPEADYGAGDLLKERSSAIGRTQLGQ